MMARRLAFKAAALSAAFFLLGCAETPVAPVVSFGPDLVVPVSSPKTDAGLEVTLATWNVEGFDRGGQTPSGTYAGIAAALKNASVEVAAFEEVQSDDLPKFVAAAQALGWTMPYSSCSSLSDHYNALAVASKYPIVEASEILAPAGKWPRSVYKVRIDIGKGLTLFVAHLKSGADNTALQQRRDEAAALGAYLRTAYGDALATENLVILGDMNSMSAGDRGDTLSTLSLLQLREDGSPADDFTSMTESLLSSPDAYSWEGVVSGLWTQSALDHLILSPRARTNYVAGSLQIHRSDPAVTMTANSDHYPVVLDIKL
jgi:endonuclease/exonuclease/phosphatase family metal-dependent hydrolase